MGPGRRIRRIVCAVCAVGTLAACSPGLPRGRSWISGALTRRAGGGLRPDAGDARPWLPAGLRLDDGLTSDEAVAVALANNAAFQAELARLGLAQADLAEAGLLPNPTLSLLFPVAAKPLEVTLSWGLGWLWQRPRRVAAARLDATRAAGELVQRGLDLARDVRVAHAEVLRAQELRRLAREEREVWGAILRLTEARLAAGDASRLEVEIVRARAASADLTLVEASRDEQVAAAQFGELLGWPGAPPRVVASAPAALPDPAALVRLALAERPDLRAAEQAIEAAGERAGLARAQIVDLVAELDAEHDDTGWQSGPGVQVPLPLFDVRQAGRLRARAELERAAWNRVALKRRVVAEVQAAHARLARADAALHAWEADGLPRLEENLRLARRGYEEGAEPYLVVLEATRGLLEGRRRRIELEAERRRAAAELERSVGGRPRARR